MAEPLPLRIASELGKRSPLTVHELAERLAVPSTVLSEALASLLRRRLVATVGGRLLANPVGSGQRWVALWALVQPA